MDCLKVILNSGEVLEPRKIIRRRVLNGNLQNLVKWKINHPDENSLEDCASTSTALTLIENKTTQSICLWMSDDELQLCCPNLCHKNSCNDSTKNGSPETGDLSTSDMEYFDDMKLDVSLFVKRARNQMEKIRSNSAKKPLINLSHTLQVLNTYASFDMMSSVFRETGALDLILDLMFSTNIKTRHAAGKILRALASHDAGSRAYVLLALTKEKNQTPLVKENDHLVDYEHCSMVMELFSETASSEEAQVVALDLVQLPHVSSKILFTLMKKYLRVASLFDENQSQTFNQFNWMFLNENRLSTEKFHKFDVAMVISDLILTLSQIMGWRLEPTVDKDMLTNSKLTNPTKEHKSLFPKKFKKSSVDKKLLATLLKLNKTSSTYKTLGSFETKREYSDYLRSEVTLNCWLKLTIKYPDVNIGEEGNYKQYDESRQHPVQVYWPRLGRTTWVNWDDLTMMGTSNKNSDILINSTNPENSILWPILSGMTCKVEKFYEIKGKKEAKTEVISQSEWWNMLFVASYMKTEVKTEILKIIKEKFSNLDHLSCFIPDKETLIKILFLIDINNFENSNEKGHLQNISQLIKSAKAEDKNENSNQPSTSKKNLTENNNIKKIKTGEKNVLADMGEETSYDVINYDYVTMNDVIIQSDDVVKQRAKAQEMGLRINLIVDDKTSKKFTKLLMIDENYKFSEHLILNFTKSPNLNHVGNLFQANYENEDKLLLMLTYLAYIVTSHKAPCLRNENSGEAKDYISKLALPFSKTSKSYNNDIIIAYIHLVYSYLNDTGDKLIQQESLESIFATTGHIQIILELVSNHPDNLEVVEPAILCISKVMMASQFAESASTNNFNFSLLSAVLCSIITDETGNSEYKETRGVDLMTNLVHAISLMVQTSEKSFGDEIFYEISCLICMILRQDKSNIFLTQNKEILKKIHATLFKEVGGKTRKMMLRWKGLMVSMTVVDILEDNISEDELHIGHFQLSDVTKPNLVEKSVNLTDKLDSLSDKQVKEEVKDLICNNVLQKLRTSIPLSDSLLHCVETFKVFMEKYKKLNPLLDEEYWTEVLNSLNQILVQCSNESSSTVTNLSIEIAKNIIEIFEIMIEIDQNFAAQLCVLETKQVINKLQDKHGVEGFTESMNKLKKTIQTHEHQLVLNNRVLAIILGGCISNALECVDEARKENKLINIPMFRGLLENLCKGSEIDTTDNKCWEKIEVSSNSRHISKLTDGNPETYWESNGNSGAHWIEIYVKKGIIIRKMTITVAQEDSSYMPARVVVFGGTTSSDTTQICSVTLGSLENEIVILENAKKYWPLIKISIRRCQQGGIDTRIHGLKIIGPKPSFWPTFHHQLYVRTTLYYNVQAQMWLGENCGVKQILEVPKKYMSVLKHEQEFADSFLPTAESALVLGQACQSVLSGPILKVLFKKEANKETNLGFNENPPTLFGKLIAQYFIQYHDQTNSIPSKFRQLIRLLLDLDSAHGGENSKENTKNTENVENVRNWTKKVQPGPGFKNTTTSDKGSESENLSHKQTSTDVASSSVQNNDVHFHIGLIMKSWSELTGSKFSEFLNEVLSTFEEKNEDQFKFVFDQIYKESKKLEKCTKELFSNEIQFSILCPIVMWNSVVFNDIKNSVKICFIFCTIIHNHLTGKSNDYRIFDQVKEILPVCSNLFSTFEEVYCLFLSERLLNGISVSLKLEIETCTSIQMCFFKRNPVKMLQDVKTSHEMMQRFTCNYLENYDHELTNNFVENQEEIWKNYNFLSNGNFDVKVIWPGFKLPSQNPLQQIIKVIPKVAPELSDWMTNFESFCRNERIGNSNCLFEKGNTALHWTWLGCGELHDLKNQINLNVTTLQMVILLHFNSADKVDVKSYMECKEGKFAVDCLIKKKIVILKENFLTLRNNIENNVNCVLDNMTSLQQVDDIISYASTARKAVLDCAIVRIVKQEVNILCDLVIENVIKYCYKPTESKYTENKTQERFLPAVNDIKTRCDHLVNLGYIFYSNDKQALSYTQDEVNTELQSTKTKNVSSEAKKFVKEQPKSFKKLNNEPKIVNLWKDISKTPFQKPLSIFSGLDFENVQLTESDIFDKITSSICYINEIAKVGLDIAEALLIEFEWNLDKLMASYFENTEVTLEKISFSSPDAIFSSECPICLTETDKTKLYALYCGHRCCKQCLVFYIQTQLDLDLAAYTTCFIPNCNARITSQVYNDLCKKMFAKYGNSLTRSFIEANRDISFCHNPKGCEKIVSKTNQGKCMACGWQTCFSCSYVEDHQPATCGHMSQWIDDGGYYHCMDEDAQSHHLARLIAKRCPNCHANIEKNHGCLHMKCAKCQHDFCWRCLQSWQPTHKDYFHCSSKVSKFAHAGFKFIEYNKRCQYHNKAKQFAFDVHDRLTSYSDPAINHLHLKFAFELCTKLIECRKVLAYSNIFSYYTYQDKTACLTLHCTTLENKTLELQEFITELLLKTADIKYTVSQISDDKITQGLRITNECSNLISSVVTFAEQNPKGIEATEIDENNLEKGRPAGLSDNEQSYTTDWSTMDDDEDSSDDDEIEDEDSLMDDYYDNADLYEAGHMYDQDADSEQSVENFGLWM